jgi:hypothetical protein
VNKVNARLLNLGLSAGESKVAIEPLDSPMSLEEAVVVLGLDDNRGADDQTIMVAFNELVPI